MDLDREPVFSFTTDLDWASEYCISELLTTLVDFDVKPTVFVTHESQVIAEFERNELIELGVHPNFLKGSTHGTTYEQVIDHVFKLAPSAEVYRSHCYYDNFHVTKLMYDRGIRLDSNLCLHLQPNIQPLYHSGMMKRVPVFWEDDIAFRQPVPNWDLESQLEMFLSPGLKVLNVHPFYFATNTPTNEHYLRKKSEVQTLRKGDTSSIHSGAGTKQFVLQLLKFLKQRRIKFVLLSEYMNANSRQTVKV